LTGWKNAGPPCGKFSEMGAFLKLKEVIDKLAGTFPFGKKRLAGKSQEALATLKIRYDAVDTENETLKKEKSEIMERMKNLEANLIMAQESNEYLARTIGEQDIKLRNFDLVSDALKAMSVANSFIDEFDSLIKNDFVKFCDIEPGLNDTIPLQKLQHILKEMRTIANCPALHSKGIGAVGGGYSSGKSSFLNSFLTGSTIRLAEGIRPVTAIPSYVMYNDKPLINGITYKGGLFEISHEVYNAISHEFLKSFTFNLKEIILYTTVLVPIKKELFADICLIDTPGYNPPGSGTLEHDFEMAKEYIKDAGFLIWMVGLDTNGTMPKSDLDFLSKLDFGKTGERPLYIVANKAELKTEEDIEDILDDFEDRLDDSDLQYAGICAYSSKTKKIYASRKMDVHEFLLAHNKPNQKYESLNAILHEVFSEYISEINDDYNEKETKRREIKKLLLKALESGSIGLDESTSELEEGLNSFLRYFQSKEDLKARIQRVKDLRENFASCLDKFCDEMGMERMEYIYCTGCGTKLKKGAQFCTECGKKL
jgi:exonuclease VII small subunit